MHPDRSPATGLVLALLSAAAFATSGIFARSLLEAGWSAEAAVVARVGIAAVILAPAAGWALRGNWGTLRRNLGRVGLFGLLGVAGAQACFFNAVRHLPVGVALLLEYLAIILVVGWQWAVHRQRPQRLTIAGSAAALVGLVLVLELTGPARLHPLGVLWALGAAAGLAGYFIVSTRVDRELPSVVLASGGMVVGTTILLGLGVAGVAPLRATFETVEFAGHRLSWLVPVLGLALVAALIAYVTGVGANRILGARLASFVGLTEVLFAILIAWLLLSELPTLVQLAGGVLILAGVALVRLDELRPARPRAAATPAPAPSAAPAP